MKAIGGRSDTADAWNSIVHGEPPRPVPSDGVEERSVQEEDVANLGFHAHVAVWVRQQTLNGDQDFGKSETCSAKKENRLAISPL